jgi:hypothetical protein
MAKLPPIQLTVEESLVLSQDNGYWDGYAAGVAAAAEHAKRLALNKLIQSRKPEPPPAQPEPPKED